MSEGEVAEEVVVVLLRKVATVVCSPAFLTSEGTANDGFRDIERVFQNNAGNAEKAIPKVPVR